jgi:hypothetical protein
MSSLRDLPILDAPSFYNHVNPSGFFMIYSVSNTCSRETCPDAERQRNAVDEYSSDQRLPDAKGLVRSAASTEATA